MDGADRSRRARRQPGPLPPADRGVPVAFRAPAPPRDPSSPASAATSAGSCRSWRAARRGADESPVLLGEAVVRLATSPHGGRPACSCSRTCTGPTPRRSPWSTTSPTPSRDQPVLCVCTTRPRGPGARPARAPAAPRRRHAPRPRGRSRPTTSRRSWPPASAPTHARPMSSRGSRATATATRSSSRSCSPASSPPARSSSATAVGDHRPAAPPVPQPRRVDPAPPRRRSTRRARRVIRAAALLGRRFDWELLPGIAEVDGRAVVDALRAAVDEQLIEVDGDGFLFRHALTREAVLADLLPPERRDLAPRAWPAVERANPGLPGAGCELAADLAEAAGEPADGGRRLVESARRALAGGAFATAEATASRARRLAPSDDRSRSTPTTCSCRSWPPPASPPRPWRSAGTSSTRSSDASRRRRHRPPPRPGPRAALAPATPATRPRLVDAARRAASTTTVAAAARVDAVAADVALDQGELVEAGDAGPARRRRRRPHRPAGGRLRGARGARPASPTSPNPAPASGGSSGPPTSPPPTGWPAGTCEPSTSSRSRRGATATASRSRDTRDLAARTGALVTVAVMDLSLADIALAGVRPRRLPGRRRPRASTPAAATAWPPSRSPTSGSPAATPSPATTSPWRRRSPTRWPATPTTRGSSATCTAGCSSTRAFVADDLGSLRAHLDDDDGHVDRAPPATSVFPGRTLWATLHASDDDDLGAQPCASCQALGRGHRHAHHGLAALASRRVARGRRGEHARADGARRGGARQPRCDHRSVPASGTASRCSCPRPPSATAGATRSPGCARRRRSSPPAATSEPPAAAAR